MPPRRRTNYGAAANRNIRPSEPAQTPQAQIRTKPVRITIDLNPELYSEVKKRVRQLAVELDKDVPLATVARALFSEWLNSTELDQSVREKLQ